MSDVATQEVYETFNEVVNLQPKELEEWLQTEESKAVGDRDSGESTGHRSGRRIVRIKRTAKADLTDSDYEHMRKVVGYVRRHLAQRPSGDVQDTPWRYSLMNWGHDPFAPTDEPATRDGERSMTFVKAYAGVIISFLVIDAVWIVFVAKPLYERSIGHLLRESPGFLAAGVFYLAYAAGVVLLACQPALSASSPKVALVNGAVLGALAYGTFTITNFSLLKGWTTGLVVSDILWGAVLTAATAWVGYFVARG